MSESPSFERLTVVQLRESCQRRGLESTGLKRELINRLKAHEAEKKETMESTEEVKEPEVAEEQKVEPEVEEVKVEPEVEEVRVEPEVAEEKVEPEEPTENGKMETDQEENQVEENKEEKKKETKSPAAKEPAKKKTGTTADELLPDGRPKNLGKQKFQYGYMKTLSMKCVAVHPFRPEIFQNEVFLNYFDKAINYSIKNTKWSKTSGVIMEFSDVDEGDEAWGEIHRALADDDTKVEHPDFHTDSTFWSHRVDTSLDWLLNFCVLKEMEFRDQFIKRLLLFENVPEGTTHAEFVAEFPEARNLIMFGYDTESPGMVGVELFSERKAEEFMEKYANYEFKGAKLSLEFYNVRFNRFDKIIRRYRKEHPEEAEFAALSDDDRLVKVKEYLALNEAKKEVNHSYDYTGTEKIQKCQELSEAQVPLARHLFSDAKRRQEQGMGVPEPSNEQTAMVKNLLEGKINQRKERAAEGNKIAIEREKKERERLLQGLKLDSEKKGKRPATSGSNLSGYPPHKKFQQSRGGSSFGGMSRGRGGMGRGGMGRGMDHGMGGMDRGMGYMERGMGSMDRGMGMMDRGMGMNRGMGGMDRGMGGMDRGMGGMDRGMGGMDRGMGGMDRGMGGGFDDGLSSVSRTVQALTDKVRLLEMWTSRGGSRSGGGGGGGGMGSGGYDSYGSMQRGSAHSLGHRGHSAGGRRW